MCNDHLRTRWGRWSAWLERFPASPDPDQPLPPGRARRQAGVVLLASAVALVCYLYYHPWAEPAWNTVLFCAGIPLLTLPLLGGRPSRWGLGAGRWRMGAGLVVAGLVGLGVVLWLARLFPSLAEYYSPGRPEAAVLAGWLALAAIRFTAWEFLWRGYLLFGLEPALGPLAVYVQALPFALVHAGKPAVETWSSIAGGVLLGQLCLRCRSFWPAAILHALLYAGIHFAV